MRILILDDDEIFAHMLADQLKRLMPDWNATAVGCADDARAAVRDAADAFDVMLLDLRLDGSNVDGVGLMEELKQASPISDAILFTGYDVEEGLRAFDAGAYRYLTKPFDTRELVRILKVLQRERKIRRERDWLQIMTEVASQMQATNDIHALANIIVRGGLRFGFQRARLRVFEQAGQETGDDPEMVSFSQAGEPRVKGFEGLRAPLSRLIYSQRAFEAGRPLCFDGRELGPGAHDEFYAAHGLPPPRGHWFKLPLLSGGQAVGALTLDNGKEERFFGVDMMDQLTQALALFGSQAADALERARLHQQATHQAEKAEKLAEETELLSKISRQVTTVATQGNLDELLDEVRRQVGRLMDVTNFMVVLKDLEVEDLDFRRQYEQDVLSQRHWRAAGRGLCGLIIEENVARIIQDTEHFCSEQAIRHYGRPARCWLGVPLRVEGQAIGALVVQSYQDQNAYTAQHEQLLPKVAEHVAGAIHMAYQLERKAELEQEDQALKDLRRAMPRLIQESEDSFWHAVLTTITHREGNSFNRAALFWYDQADEQMQGRMGIGCFSRAEARLAWEQDLETDQTLQQYFAAPYQARQRITSLQKEVIDWRLATSVPAGPCHRPRVEGRRQVISSSILLGYLPDKLLQPPDLLDEATAYPCALLPIKSDDKVWGLLVVDNAFDGEPLRSGDLDKLETLLAEAMLVWSRHREASQARQLGSSYEQLLILDHRLTAKMADQPLRETLQLLCQETQALTGAGCVVLYPYHSSRGGYDLSLVSHVGLEAPDEFKANTKDKPRQHGVTFTILQSGVLAVPDVSASDRTFGGRRLAEHSFLLREHIKALIGVPLRQAATGEGLGVIYLDYRTPQTFGELDIVRAEHVAAIGAKIISYRREIERQEFGLAEAERREQQRRREMQFLGNIQQQALAGESDEQNIINAILKNAAELFGRSAVVTLALLSWENRGGQNRQVRQDWHLGKLEPSRPDSVDMDKGPIGKALHRNEPCKSKNLLIIPVRLGEKMVGALAIKKTNGRATFSAVEQEVAERLATVAALALDNMRTRAYLQILSETVGAVSDERGLKETLNAVRDKARKVAPDIDCVTLWYQDQETGHLVAGTHWGVMNEDHRDPNLQTKGLVHKVMERRAPIFASTVEKDQVLWGDFTREEQIASVAAFPLRFGEGQKALGALFFNYRKTHEFTPLERTLFPIFANAATTAIHSAQTIELAERRRKRLATALNVATKAGATLKEDDVVHEVLTILRDEFRRESDDKTAPYFMRHDERDQVLELHEMAYEFYRPDRPEYQHRVRLSLDDPGLTCQAAREALAAGHVVVMNVPNVHNYEGYVEVNSETKTELCAGLVKSGRLLGVLVIKSARLAAFDKDDERLFEMTAQQVALALDRLERAAKERRNDSVAGAMAWAADIAHDINNDVGYIRNRAYWLRESEPPISEEGRTRAREIDARAKQLADSVRDARFPRQELEAFSLKELLHERATAWAATRAANTDVLIEAIDPCIMYSDREQLWRSVRHLLRNARDAMEAAQSEHRRITLRLKPLNPDLVDLQIEDTGPGVDEEARRRILREPYSTKGGEGSGYGLLIAQWLVESVGGSIYLYPPVPGCGARFGIRLPLKYQEERYDHSQ